MLDKQEALREPMDMPDPHFPIKVHQVRCGLTGKVLFPHHWHEHIEFIYIVSGEAAVECGPAPIHARPGDLIVANSNELHYGACLSPDLFYYALILDPVLLHSHAPDAAETKFIGPIRQNRLLFRNLIRNDKATADCLQAIVRELNAREFGYELAVKSELYRMLALLLRGHVATVLTRDEYAERLKNVQRFEPVFAYIDAHYRDGLTVDHLASIAGLSRYHFSRLFKDICGRTITEHITSVRLDKADHLLRTTPMTVTEIASACGFNDIYYFSRTFKKYKQVPPSAVRNG